METNASKGWVPVDAAGQVWQYETANGKGELLIQRTPLGTQVYEVTYRSATIRDVTIATDERDEALRFAMTGKDALQNALDDLEAEGIVERVLRPFTDEPIYRATPLEGTADLPPARLSAIRHTESSAPSPV